MLIGSLGIATCTVGVQAHRTPSPKTTAMALVACMIAPFIALWVTPVSRRVVASVVVLTAALFFQALVVGASVGYVAGATKKLMVSRLMVPLSFVGDDLVMFSLSFLCPLRICRPPPLPLPDDDNHDDDKRRRIHFSPPSLHRHQTPTAAAIRRYS